MSVFQIHWQGVNACKAMLAAFQAIMPSAPDEFSVRIGITVNAAGAEPLATVNGQLFGSVSELTEILAPALSAAAPADQDIKEMTYWQGKDFLADLEGPSCYAERSRYVTDPLPSEAIEVIFDRLAQWPGGGSATAKLFSWGGAISRIPRDATAFVHRDALFLASFSVGWPTQTPSDGAQTELEWLNLTFDAFLLYTVAESYQNFIDPALIDWQTAYYGENLERLMSIKAVYDPTDFFQFSQGIPLPVGQRESSIVALEHPTWWKNPRGSTAVAPTISYLS
ncbi:MAG: BBE domain-containing protein [Oligoflexia bacterium]|nr:BBE domain-containing protein [Oligoflexia bacterium]